MLASLAVAASAEFETGATALRIGDNSLLTLYDFMSAPYSGSGVRGSRVNGRKEEIYHGHDTFGKTRSFPQPQISGSDL